ncbi:hypothetical protein [Thermosipho sp. (in: thermotogales)]|jgi:hypothetical protein|uniref:hypothetical protein n=1 Tax=Thermosipho sp. (in: thermotogales) TaxID=1968895 RepID=UPI0025809E15|nr:hypothetical protein [Thermosipho sp. (in: thermotogales)]MBZ4650894.1 hypothetical protein [Thermosipho sp. (in: thermotogales)]MDK2906248.1 hypothetical protein [Petrotoga sp.]
MNYFYLDIEKIMPSQLYISKEKLKNVLKYIKTTGVKNISPVPIKEINNIIFYTDGHTRAYALWKMGAKKIKVIWETEELDWKLYLICIEWCKNAKINNISDLKVISHNQYKKLWLKRCENMHKMLYSPHL